MKNSKNIHRIFIIAAVTAVIGAGTYFAVIHKVNADTRFALEAEAKLKAQEEEKAARDAFLAQAEADRIAKAQEEADARAAAKAQADAQREKAAKEAAAKAEEEAKAAAELAEAQEAQATETKTAEKGKAYKAEEYPKEAIIKDPNEGITVGDDGTETKTEERVKKEEAQQAIPKGGTEKVINGQLMYYSDIFNQWFPVVQGTTEVIEVTLSGEHVGF